tara:strand:+ start:792 stop:1328 length:537 start_codon:yes stop_codon:yes gene_type:complete
MNTHTLSISTNNSNFNRSIILDQIDLFDVTNFGIDLVNVYSEIYPNYLSIDWGDGTAVEIPDIIIHRDYKTESIFPEINKGGAPVYLVKDYKHIYYPSTYALNKSIMFKLNIGYVTGETTQLSAPINVRTNSYFETIDDLEVVGLDLLDNKNNSSRFTFLTKKDSYILQMDNRSYKGD